MARRTIRLSADAKVRGMLTRATGPVERRTDVVSRPAKANRRRSQAGCDFRLQHAGLCVPVVPLLDPRRTPKTGHRWTPEKRPTE